MVPFAQIYAENKHFIGHLTSWMVPESCREDVVQQVWITVYRKLDRAPSPDRLKKWLAAIIRNVFAHERRTYARHHRRVDSLAQEPSIPNEPHKQRDAEATLQALIDQLTPKLREAYVLVEILGHTAQEGARILGISAKTVESRVASARKKLAELAGAAGIAWVLGMFDAARATRNAAVDAMLASDAWRAEAIEATARDLPATSPIAPSTWTTGIGALMVGLAALLWSSGAAMPSAPPQIAVPDPIVTPAGEGSSGSTSEIPQKQPTPPTSPSPLANEAHNGPTAPPDGSSSPVLPPPVTKAAPIPDPPGPPPVDRVRLPPKPLPGSTGEVSLLREAQSLLDNGKARRALRMLRQHEKRFRRGTMADLRERFRVSALCQLNRVDDARAAAAAFQAKFPGSTYRSEIAHYCWK